MLTLGRVLAGEDLSLGFDLKRLIVDLVLVETRFGLLVLKRLLRGEAISLDLNFMF